jgi:hypothetical protein
MFHRVDPNAKSNGFHSIVAHESGSFSGFALGIVEFLSFGFHFGEPTHVGTRYKILLSVALL